MIIWMYWFSKIAKHKWALVVVVLMPESRRSTTDNPRFVDLLIPWAAADATWDEAECRADQFQIVYPFTNDDQLIAELSDHLLLMRCCHINEYGHNEKYERVSGTDEYDGDGCRLWRGGRSSNDRWHFRHWLKSWWIRHLSKTRLDSKWCSLTYSVACSWSSSGSKLCQEERALVCTLNIISQHPHTPNSNHH